MFRDKIAGSQRKRRDRISWRCHEVLRIEAFSDAVFAFAITLLIVSLEVPKTFDELMEGVRSFLPFSICFAMLFQVWMTQNVFFRRYGMSDNLTLMLNAMLLFVVLFFVYPLKFLFSSVLLHNYHLKFPGEVAQLFLIYSGGYSAIYFLFTIMYWNALRHRDRLELTASEAFETKTNIYRNLVMTGIGLLSVGIACCGSLSVFAWMPYVLIGPAIGMMHGRRGRLHAKKYESVEVATN